MSSAFGESVWVFHAGALGDHVMIWPLVRAMARQGSKVTVVAAASHARLCEREAGAFVNGGGAKRVVGISAEMGRFTRMWAGTESEERDVVRGVSTVLSFVASEADEGGRLWMGAAREMFPKAAIECVGMPGSASRRAVWQKARVIEFGGVAAVENAVGPIVLFTGAGGASKRWPMERWVKLAARLEEIARVELLAGSVEAERLDAKEREMFERAGGRVIGTGGDLEPLTELARNSRMFIGCDTGPTHLAAQLGVPAIALFGPTDPSVWSPVGAQVRVIAPERPAEMGWLSVEDVVAAAREMVR